MKQVLGALALCMSATPLFAEEFFQVSHPTVTGENITNVYAYVPDFQSVEPLYPSGTVFRNGIVSIVEVVDGIDFIFHPGAVLVMGAEDAEFIRGRLEGIGEPDKLLIEQLSE